jgi:hypothetical protein
MEGDIPAAESDGVQLLSTEDGTVFYLVDSGKYTFTSKAARLQ